MSHALIRNFQLSFQACGCNSRCFHCSISNEARRMGPLPLAHIRRCVDAAIAMNRLAPAFYKNLNVMWLSEPADYPQLVQLVRLSVGIGGPTAKTLATNGERLAKEPQLLPKLKAAGLEKIQLSFYGLGDEHDRLEGRKGAWSQKLCVARAAVENGLTVITQVFFRWGYGSDIEQIIQAVDNAAGSADVDHSVTVWIAAGRGRRLDRWVPTEADFNELPDRIRALRQLNEFKPEKDWVQLAHEGRMHKLLELYLRLTHDRGAPELILSLGRQNVSNVQELLDKLYAKAQEGQGNFKSKLEGFCDVPLSDWANEVGDPQSTRMYKVIHMRQEWWRRLRGQG